MCRQELSPERDPLWKVGDSTDRGKHTAPNKAAAAADIRSLVFTNTKTAKGSPHQNRQL